MDLLIPVNERDSTGNLSHDIPNWNQRLRSGVADVRVRRWSRHNPLIINIFFQIHVAPFHIDVVV